MDSHGNESLSSPRAETAILREGIAEWIIGGVVSIFACSIAAHFLWQPRQRALFSVFARLFDLYEINGAAVSGWLTTSAGAIFIVLVIAFLIASRLLLDRGARFWLRAALFGLCFAGGLLAMPVLSALGLIQGVPFDGRAVERAIVWVSVALAVAAASVCLWERLLPAWIIYALAFGIGLAALGVISPLEWNPVFYCASAWLLYCLLIGRLAMACWDTYMPPRAHQSTAFVVGLSATGVMMELLAMAHLFSRWPIVVAAAVLAIVLGIIAAWRQKRPVVSGDGTPLAEQATPEQVRAVRWRAAVDRYETTTMPARGVAARAAVQAALWLTYAITALTFYHGMGYAETYWDSLILYLGYARMVFLEHAYPFKAVAQVGIGLGANYPHLFPTLAATGPALAGRWSAIGGQMAAPLAGAVSCILAYHIALRLTRRESVAAFATLLFRAIPLGIGYFIYATDYSFGILFTIAFIYLSILYIETAVPSYLVLMTLICAGACHINYLMPILWAPWALTVFLAHAGRRFTVEGLSLMAPEMRDGARIVSEMRDRPLEEGQVLVDEPPPYAEDYPRAGLRDTLRSKWFWTLATVAALMSSTWFIRNTVLTGNPVYAFFPEWFGGVHINLEVLDSARHEWIVNGEGIARVADQRLGIPYDDLTLWDKLRNAPWYFYSYGLAWRWQPIFFAFVLPGAILAIGALVRRLLFPNRQWRTSALRMPVARRQSRVCNLRTAYRILQSRLSDFDRVGFLGLFMLALFLFYHFALADFYLYQILPILAVWPIFFVYTLEAPRGAPWRQLTIACAFAAALVPGTAMALMGFKIPDMRLAALRRPGMTQMQVIRERYGQDDAAMVDYINSHCVGTKILTHENRHLLFDSSIAFIHIDDWEVQQLWGLPPADVLAGLRRLAIAWYLRVPNEANHRVNRRLGLQNLIDTGQLKRVAQWGKNELYALSGGAIHTPAKMKP